MKIESVKVRLVDIPSGTPGSRPEGPVRLQNYAIVEVRTGDGLVGLGEAMSHGGPVWSEESAESAKLVIDRFLTPVVVSENPFNVERILKRMDLAARGNLYAKSAVEMALFDIMGKALDQPVYNLLGGLYQDRIELSWTLGKQDAKAEIEEFAPLWERGHRILKVKVGRPGIPVEKDIVRIKEIRQAYPTGRLRLDVNQGWDEATTLWAMDGVRDCNVEILEQPVPRSNLDGMASLRQRLSVPLMADESVCTPADAVALVRHNAADIFALKLIKAGGFIASKQVAGIAVGAGIPCYMGCMRETGVGTAAYAHFVAATPAVSLGCELFGPITMIDDIVAEPIQYENAHIIVPGGPGLGVSLDEDKVRHYTRNE